MCLVHCKTDFKGITDVFSKPEEQNLGKGVS